MVLVVALASTGCNRPITGTSKKHVRIAIGGRAALDFVPVYLASALGHFATEGLEVELQDFPGTSKAMQAMLGGSADLVAGGYESVIHMAAEGQSLQSIAVLERWIPYLIVVTPKYENEVHRISDLKGRKVGVAALGSTTHQFLNFVLSKNGMKPSDVTTIAVGVNITLAAAVRQASVEAAVTGPYGHSLVSENSTPTVLADCRTAEGAKLILGASSMPNATLIAKTSWTAENSDSAHKVGRAVRRVLNWMQEHSAEEIAAAMPSEYKPENSAVYLRAMREMMPAFSRDGMMPPDGPAAALSFLSASDSRFGQAKIDLAATYTDRFVATQ